MARFSYPAGGGGSASANVADFIFTNNEPENNSSSITLPGDKQMEISAGSESDLYLSAGDDLYIQAAGDDIFIRASDDIRFTANHLTNEEQEYAWRMDSEGKFQLPGDGWIENPTNSSGDGYGNDTLKLVPDADLEYNDQYLIIDPTVPNHIHIRAGGTIDESSSELILGGEKTYVKLVDGSGIARMQASYTYNNTYYPGDWTSAVVTEDESNRTIEITDPAEYILEFLNSTDWNNASGVYIGFDGGEKGFIYGQNSTETTLTFFLEPTGTPSSPTAIASLELYYEQRSRVDIDMNDDEELAIVGNGIDVNISSSEGISINANDNINIESENNISIDANNNIVLYSAEGGQFLNSSEFPNNQIATIGDIANARADLYYGSFYDLTDQTASAGSIQAMKFGQTDISNGVSIGGVNNTQITIANDGVYNIAFSAQLHQTNSQGVIQIWLNKNGAPMTNTNTKMHITSNNPFYVAAWNLLVDADADDYFELMWSSDSANTVLEHEAQTGSGPTLKPAIPSVILTVNQVGQ